MSSQGKQQCCKYILDYDLRRFNEDSLNPIDDREHHWRAKESQGSKEIVTKAQISSNSNQGHEVDGPAASIPRAKMMATPLRGS